MNDYYVYIYWRLDTNEPFYVGMGHGRRWRRTDVSSRGYNKHFMNIVNKHPVAVTIEMDSLTEEQAFGIECWLINELVFEYGFSIDIKNNRSKVEGFNLCNRTWGGEGGMGCNPWENLNEEEKEEYRRRLSEIRIERGLAKGEDNPMWGKNLWDYMSEETKEKAKRKISEKHKGKNNYWYGKGHLRGGKNNPRAKSVICLVTKRIFFTAKEGAEHYNIKNVGDIGNCCKGKLKSVGKLIDGTRLVWRWLNWNHNKKYRIKNN